MLRVPAERVGDLVEGSELALARARARRAEKSAFGGNRGHALRQPEDEPAVILELLDGRAALEQTNRLPETLDRALADLGLEAG